MVVDRARVGTNLQDHLQVRLIYKCTKPITTNDELRIRSSAGFASGCEWLLRRSGPLAVGINQGGCSRELLPESRDAGHPVPHRHPERRHGRRQRRIPIRASPCRSASCGPKAAGQSRWPRTIPWRRRRMHANYLSTETRPALAVTAAHRLRAQAGGNGAAAAATSRPRAAGCRSGGR